MNEKESATARLFRLLETERTLSDFPAACVSCPANSMNSCSWKWESAGKN